MKKSPSMRNMKPWTDPKCFKNKQDQDHLQNHSIHLRKSIFPERYPLHNTA